MSFSMPAKADIRKKACQGTKSLPVLQQVSMITVDCVLARGDSIASHFIIVGIGF